MFVLLEAWQPMAIRCADAALCIEMCCLRRNARAGGRGRDVRPWRDLLRARRIRLPGWPGAGGREGQAHDARQRILAFFSMHLRPPGTDGSSGGTHPDNAGTRPVPDAAPGLRITYRYETR